LQTEVPHVIGIDLGGYHVSAAVVNPEGHLIGISERTVERFRPPAEVLAILVSAAREALERSGLGHEAIRGIGVGLPGTLRPTEGLCLFSTILNWQDVQIRDPIQEALGLPTCILNNVHATAVGELSFGAGKDVDNFACVSIGTGIGGGVIIGGEIYRGDSDSAGEVGHITVDPDGPECVCGNQGCLEALTAGPAIARMAAESLKLGAQSLLTDMAAQSQPIRAEHVFRAAREGDALAIKIWEKVGRYLGLGIATLITLVNPRRVILGGRVSQAFEFFGPSLKEEVRRRARVVPRDFTEILPSPLGARASLLGSAATALAEARCREVATVPKTV